MVWMALLCEVQFQDLRLQMSYVLDHTLSIRTERDSNSFPTLCLTLWHLVQIKQSLTQ